ncbi:hypothetical protein B566_EDAN000730 [Ephemera danica]|nr:hypothetical protein B566_EDAN000730 [Ephemera danica]
MSRMNEDSPTHQAKRIKKCVPSLLPSKRKHSLVEKIYGKNKVNVEQDVEQQIFHSQLPSYTPEKSAFAHDSSQLFTCIDCGDRFMLESSLNQHLIRRSVKICAWQPGVSKPEVFYNRCKLLASLRQNMRPGVAVRISVHPLDREQLLLPLPSPSSTIGEILTSSSMSTINMRRTASTESRESTSEQNGSVSNSSPCQDRSAPSSSSESVLDVNVQILPVPRKQLEKVASSPHQSSAEKVTVNKVKITERPTKLEHTKLDTCPECNLKLLENTDLQQHLAGLPNKKSDSFKCEKCQVPLPTDCSLKLHEIMHSSQYKSEKSFVCPECGLQFLKWDIFKEHLHKECMHAYLSSCFKCQHCVTLFPTPISLEVHILKVHIKKVYKCAICNIACYSMQALDKHRTEAHHNNTEGKPATYQLCELCPGRLITQGFLLFHVHQHAENPLNLLIRYVCEPCKIFLEHRKDFKKHKENCKHDVSNFNKPETSPSKEEQPKQLATKPILVKIPEQPKKLETDEPNKSQNNSPPEKYIRPCHKCGCSMQPYKKSVACFKCNKSLLKMAKKLSPVKKSLNDSSDDSNHVNGSVTSTDCPLCNLSINNDYLSVKKHFASKHKDIKLNRNTYQKHLLELRNQMNVTVKTENTDTSEFKCCICDLETNDEEMFREHVVQHQPEEGSTYQCLECGICYVVKPSLEKHLLLSHRIKGVDEYLRETGQELVGDQAGEGAPIKDNQCEVCYAEFEAEADLNSHLRTHGLAFLRNIS